MKYTITQFNKEFPDEEACIDELFRRRYGHIDSCPKCKKDTRFYRVKNRKSYACQYCGFQLYPLADTIFHKSSTPLKLWFYAIFLFSASKNGVSAKELQRQLGVTYKCAWRMAHQIRKLMGQDSDLLSGTVEVDETYFGKKGNNERKFKNKSALMGMVERKGKVRAKVISAREAHILLNSIKANISRDAKIMSDEFAAYKKLPKIGYSSQRVKHGKKHWVMNDVHTNTIEGFWGQLKRSIKGTYTFVSAKHLQSYVNEFAWRYNMRNNELSPAFLSLLSEVKMLGQ